MIAQKVKKFTFIPVILASLVLSLFAINASANDKSGYLDDIQIIYQPLSTHNNIYSYPSSSSGVLSLKPELIYVSQAYGPAIHSYSHFGTEKSVPFNVEYVDTAFGQAIYSYERRQLEGEVEVLPIVID